MNGTQGAGKVLTSDASGVATWQTPSAGGAVTSVFGRTGAVVGITGDYSSDEITESGSLYFTNTRAQAAMTGAASTIASLNLTPNMLVFSNGSGKIAASSIITTTEFNYLDGVTSAIQTQLNSKPTAGVSSGGVVQTNSIVVNDTRSINHLPQDRNPGFYVDFKQNSTNGLSDGGTYNGVMTFRSYGASTDFSGGYPMQVGYTANGNLWTRMGLTATGWTSWKKLGGDSCTPGGTAGIGNYCYGAFSLQ